MYQLIMTHNPGEPDQLTIRKVIPNDTYLGLELMSIAYRDVGDGNNGNEMVQLARAIREALLVGKPYIDTAGNVWTLQRRQEVA